MKDQILVSYNQICVFSSELDDPFNDWRDVHVHQGFAWREGSVSFGAIENAETDLEVSAVASYAPNEHATRIIAVPFTVPPSGEIVIGSIGDERSLELNSGTYKLIYELGVTGDDSWWCNLFFIPQENVKPSIIKADPEITKKSDFDMNATSAA